MDERASSQAREQIPLVERILVDDLLLSKMRLGIVAELLGSHWVAFSELQRALDASNGNLGAHVSKLVEAGYVDEEKTFVARRPQTRYHLTTRGRAAFVEHVAHLQSLLKGDV